MTVTAPPSGRDHRAVDDAIESAFGDRGALAVRYADLLCGEGITRGVLGPREAPRVWERHIFNSVALAPLISPAARVIDLGSGAGLPGLPLAIARPDLTVVLLEPMQRRIDFLELAVATLSLRNVDVVRARGEDGAVERGSVVVVRAVASLEALLTMASDLLVDDGVLLALKGANAQAERDDVVGRYDVDAEVLSVPAFGQAATVVRAARRSWRRPLEGAR